MARVVDVLQAAGGLLVLAGFWWVVFAVIRLFEQNPAGRRRSIGPGIPSVPAAAPPTMPGVVSQSARGRRATPCCPDCSPGCQITGLAMGQAWGRGYDWWGKPFGEDGANTEAMVLWGDGCCPDCAQCPICQGAAEPRPG